MCETKACKICGEEKPLSAFHKSIVGDKVYYKGACGPCRYARKSDAAKESKRARDRFERKNSANAIQRLKRSQANRMSKKALVRFDENIGAYSVIHWHKCEKCERLKLFKRKEADSVLCGRCGKKSAPYIANKAATCPCCQKHHIAKTSKSMCVECAKAKKKERISVYRKVRKARYNDKTFRARCRKYGGRYEPINRIKVYEKDKYKCYLCKCKVVVSETYQPNQASLDHIVPLSLGGSHTYDNVKTCCVECNGKRSNNISIPVQIGLWCQAKGDNKGGGASILNHHLGTSLAQTPRPPRNPPRSSA